MAKTTTPNQKKKAALPGGEPPRVELGKITDAVPDDHNLNKHTQQGIALLENSLRQRGAGRGILAAGKGVDKPVVIAGNQTQESSVAVGLEDAIFVHTNGDQLVVTVRDDIEPGSPEALLLAIEDNRVGEVSLQWDQDKLDKVIAENAAALEGLMNGPTKSLLEGLHVQLGKESGDFTRPEFDDLVDQFEPVRNSEKNENWLYIEYYQKPEQWEEVMALLAPFMKGKGKHEIEPDFFLAMVRDYVSRNPFIANQ